MQVNILSENYNFLIASLDLHILDMTNYRFSKANITSLRIVQNNHPSLLSLRKNWDEYSAKYLHPFGKHLNPPLYLKVVIVSKLQILIFCFILDSICINLRLSSFIG